MKKIAGSALLLLALLALGAGAFLLSRPCLAGCNVVLIMIDTLAAKHLAVYGYDRDTMPHTTAFFKKSGIIFSDASSNAAWTLPSFNSMYFSSAASNITYADLESGTRPTLQNELRAGGVTIRAIRPQGNNFIFDAITRLFKPGEVSIANGASPFTDGAKALTALARNAGTHPFFLQIHSFEVHDPYAPENPYDEEFGTSTAYPKVTMSDLLAENMKPDGPDPETADVFRLRYDQNLAQADAHIAAFLNSIPQSVMKNTVVIFAADHGEAFDEHGKVWHANSVHQEEIRIPLMMYVPGVSPETVSQPVSLLDMAPTILSFMHIAPPSAFLGKSLLPALKGLPLRERAIPSETGFPFYLQSPNGPVPKTLKEAGAEGVMQPLIVPSEYGMRIGDEKLIETADGRTALYNLAKDLWEKNNLADTASLPQNLVSALQALKSEAKR